MEVTTEEYIKDINDLRQVTGELGKSIRAMMKHKRFDSPLGPNEDSGESKANIMLAFRHIEDARMRLGKAIQAMEGGVSIYDVGSPSQ